MGQRFLSYNTEDAAAGRINVDSNGVMRQPSWNNLSDKPDLGTSSWNDLKDKPFGEEVTRKALFDEIIPVDFPGGGGMYAPNYAEFVVGETYNVTYDGISHVLVAQTVKELGSNYEEREYIGIGNASLFESELETYENTGEPFFIYCRKSGQYNIKLNDFGVEHSVKIEIVSTSVKPLDPKFLPDDHINNLINTALGVIENGTY